MLYDLSLCWLALWLRNRKIEKIEKKENERKANIQCNHQTISTFKYRNPNKFMYSFTTVIYNNKIFEIVFLWIELEFVCSVGNGFFLYFRFLPLHMSNVHWPSQCFCCLNCFWSKMKFVISVICVLNIEFGVCINVRYVSRRTKNDLLMEHIHQNFMCFLFVSFSIYHIKAFILNITHIFTWLFWHVFGFGFGTLHLSMK